MFLSGIFRFIKGNKINAVGISMIVFVTVFLGVLFLETNQNTNANLKNIEKYNIESFSFYPSVSNAEITAEKGNYDAALEKKINSLAKKYNFDWENRNFKIIKENESVFRIYPESRTIDKFYIQDGGMPKSESVLVDLNYANENKLSVGDKLVLNQKTYSISGTVVLPDMLYPIVDNSGKLYDKRTQGFVIVTKSEYDKFKQTDNKGFVGKFKSNTDKTDKMEEDTDFYYLNSSENNPQIYSTMKSRMNMNVIILSFAMGLLASITILLIIISISRQIKGEAPNLGVLKALGYYNTEISRKYFSYFIIILIPSVLGYFAGNLSVPYFYRILNDSFLLPDIDVSVKWLNLIIFTAIPSFYFALIAFFTSVISVRKPALNMIKNIKKRKSNFFVKRRNARIREDKYLKGVRRVLTISSISAIIFIIFGGFALGVQTQFAFTTYGMTKNMTEKALDGLNYVSDVRFKNTINEKDYSDSLKYYGISAKLKNKGGDNLNLVDIYILNNGDSNTIEFYENNNRIDLNKTDGLIVNQWLQKKYNLHVGDFVKLFYDDKDHEVKIAGVDQFLFGKSIYIGEKAALDNKLISKKEYNGILTKNKIEYDSAKHISINRTDEIEETIQRSSDIYSILAILLFICGLLIGITILALALINVINDYRKYIAIMKVNGYTEKECNYTVISGFRKIAIIGYIISIPYTILLSTIMFSIISVNSDMVYPVGINIYSIVVCLTITVVITESVIWIFKRRLRKISFREVMEG